MMSIHYEILGPNLELHWYILQKQQVGMGSKVPYGQSKTHFGTTTSVEDQITRPGAGTGVLESTSKYDLATPLGFDGTGFPTTGCGVITGMSASESCDLTCTAGISTSESVWSLAEPDARCVNCFGPVCWSAKVDWVA